MSGRTRSELSPAYARIFQKKTVNVLDISQTIIDGYFNMMMIVDYSEAKDDFETIVSDLEAMSSEIGVQIRCQREEIFTSMHRV